MLTKSEERYYGGIELRAKARQAWYDWKPVGTLLPGKLGKIKKEWRKLPLSMQNHRMASRLRSYVESATIGHHKPITFINTNSKRARWDKVYNHRRDVKKRDSIPYRMFLKTSYWYAVRRKVLNLCHNTCRKCGKVGRIQVHHPTYVFVRRELETHRWRELIPLCNECHKMEHGIIVGSADK